MKLKCTYLLAVVLAMQTFSSPAAVRYVNVNNPNPASPYITWATSATTIQNAVDAANPGDQILVTNGLYQTGGRPVSPYSLTNRVVVDKAVTVQSVNGPSLTMIQGYQVPDSILGDSAVRCVYLTNNAMLIGFTLTNGATQLGTGTSQNQNGGGVWCESTNAILTNCLLVKNAASFGGGVHSGMLNGCTLVNNSGSFSGGGAVASTLNNSIFSGNLANAGGGAAFATLNNCTLTNNSAEAAGGVYFCAVANCVLIGNSGGSCSFGSTLNNCLLSGNNVYGGVSVGDTLNNSTVVGNTNGIYDSTVNNSIVYYNDAEGGANFAFDGELGGGMNYCCTTPNPGGTGNITTLPAFVNLAGGDFHLQPYSPCIDSGDNDYVISANDLDGNPRIVWDRVDMGAYEFQSEKVINNVHYVNVNSTNSMPPYTNWAKAAVTIQDAIDAAKSGDQILVTNGIYQTGGRIADGSLTNRVLVDKALTIQSINGPAVTLIQGYQTPGIFNDDNAIRCVYLADNAVLSGFTLTNGATRDAGDDITEQCGGGVFGQSTSAVVSNCVIAANVAYNFGGGAIQVTLDNCILTGNLSTYGGGAALAILNNCVIANNEGPYGGGGAYEATVDNSLLIGNQSEAVGGGALECNMNNCTVVNNGGGGVHYGTFNNCILYYNDYNYQGDKFGGTILNFCCTTPQDPSSSRHAVFGMGNITNSEPAFINWTNGDFHLQPISLCINSGDNDYTSGIIDLEGNPRIRGGTVDIGAYEYQAPTSIISYAWLQQYGLTNNGSVDYMDTDSDGMSTWQEWITGTNPTNTLSVLVMTSVTSINNPAGWVVTWQSVSGINYFLQSGTNLAQQPAFSTIQSNIVGHAGTTSYTDTNAVGSGPYFYRVGVR